jgi:hypothetical protein
MAQRLLTALQDSQPGSLAELRGSLAAGTADAYSDIDLLWEVPDDSFSSVVESIPEVLGSVQPIASLRFDPAFRHSSTHRLVFVQFENLPLFWRLDLEVFAQSAQRNPVAGHQDPPPFDSDWSPTHSALMNAIAAVKALLRGREAEARGLLMRGYERGGWSAPEKNSPELIMDLCEQVARLDPAQAGLAQQVLALHRQVFA